MHESSDKALTQEWTTAAQEAAEKEIGAYVGTANAPSGKRHVPGRFVLNLISAALAAERERNSADFIDRYRDVEELQKQLAAEREKHSQDLEMLHRQRQAAERQRESVMEQLAGEREHTKEAIRLGKLEQDLTVKMLMEEGK